MIIDLLLKGFFAEEMKNPINPLWVVLTSDGTLWTVGGRGWGLSAEYVLLFLLNYC